MWERWAGQGRRGLVKESGFYPEECEATEDSIYAFMREREREREGVHV